MDMKSHIKVVAYINLVFGFLKLFIATILFIIITGGGIISGDPFAMNITFIVALAIGAILSLFALPEIFAGFGLLKFKPWARILTIIVAILDLMAIPIGTIIGIYELWVMMNEETEALFKTVIDENVDQE